MHRIIRSTSNSPSIVVIRGVYESFFGAQEKQITASYGYDAVGAALTFDSQTACVTATEAEPWLRFQLLTCQWRQQRGASSSITEAANCPAYQSIIGMGPSAVPFIIAELQSEGDEPDQWFWALKAITDADPVDAADRGNFVRMAQAWITWAKEMGYAR